MDTTAVTVDETGAADPEVLALLDHLRDYNVGIAGPYERGEAVLVAREDGRAVGLALGRSLWGWFSLERLVVREERRGCGIGDALLAAVEAKAVALGCSDVHVDTFDFQAPDFYLRHGYRVFGRLDGFPAGRTRFYLHKRLAAGAS